jgi:hypothetical protein
MIAIIREYSNGSTALCRALQLLHILAIYTQDITDKE